MAKVPKQVWLVHDRDDGQEYVTGMQPDPRRQDIAVLAGPVDVTFDVPDNRCPHCHGELPQQETAKLALLPLVVGGVYRTRGGDVIVLIENDGHHSYPWDATNECSYTNEGLEEDDCTSDFDLIERIA